MSAFTSEGSENHMRWDGRSAGFMEVWYATLNHSATGAGIWLRYTVTAPSDGDPYCELWGFVFDPDGERRFGAKQRFPIDQLAGSNGGADGALVRIGNSWLSERHLEGELSGDGTTMSWSLDLVPARRCFQHVPPALRSRVEKRISTVCSPNLSVPFSGTIKLRGEVMEFDGERGCQSHRWGSRHSASWSWAHSSGFDVDEDGVFEGVAARPSFGRVRAPTSTMLYLRFRGEDIAFNDLRGMFTARSRYEMPTWAFTARNERWKIAGAARARIPHSVQVRYTDPDGRELHCVNSELGDLAVELYGRTAQGWRHHASLSALGRCHVEFGRRPPFSELPVLL